MPISTTDQLFNLVKSMSKAEKRNFKLYAHRTQSKGEPRFIRLFDVIDKMDSYDEGNVFQKLQNLSKSQLSNLKRHLYSQILSSLRLIHIQKNIDIEIREQIDFARILYGRGLYMQSLKLLERIKSIAKDSNQDILHYEILEFEKLIEEKHITRSRTIKNKMENLIEEAENRSRILNTACKLTNLKLKIHGLYIKVGHVRNEKDAFIVQEYFRSNLPDLPDAHLTFFEKVYLHQSYVWYYYILLDFEQCLEHALKWTSLFENNPSMIQENPDSYMRGLHYVLTSLYNLGRTEEYEKIYRRFDQFRLKYQEQFNTTSQMINFLYSYTAKFNRHYLQGTFEEGLEMLPGLEKEIQRFQRLLDPHRILVFYYRIAWLYFGSGRFEQSIEYLNRIINLRFEHLREDIQGYSRLLQLLAHFELKHYNLLEYLEKSASRFFIKLKEKNRLQTEMLAFIREQLKEKRPGDNKSLLQLRKKMEKLYRDPFEKRAFLYIGVLDWVDSKLENCHIQDVITKRNRLTMSKKE